MKIMPVLAASLGLFAACVFAQDYPSREIHAVSPVSPGSGGDIVARYYSDKLSKLAGRPVIVDNKGGAQGVVGTEYAAHAKPDGYTFLITPASSMLAAQPHFFRKLPFDPFKDFAPVAVLAWLPFAIAVDAKSPIKNVGELVAALKAKPGHGFYGMGNNSGLGTAELFKEMAGLKTVQVPYKTSMQGVTALSTRDIDFLVWDATFMSGQVRAGRVRILAVTSLKRASALPDVPTMAESGFPGFEATTWYGLVGPAKLPLAMAQRMNEDVNKALAMPDVVEKLNVSGAEDGGGSIEKFAQFMVAEQSKWAKVIRESHVKVDS